MGKEPPASLAIEGFTLERFGHRVFIGTDLDGLTLPVTATMELAIRFHAELGDAIADFQRENGAQVVKLSDRGPMFLKERGA
jgi:hypothetical protein